MELMDLKQYPGLYCLGGHYWNITSLLSSLQHTVIISCLNYIAYTLQGFDQLKATYLPFGGVCFFFLMNEVWREAWSPGAAGSNRLYHFCRLIWFLFLKAGLPIITVASSLTFFYILKLSAVSYSEWDCEIQTLMKSACFFCQVWCHSLAIWFYSVESTHFIWWNTCLPVIC